MALKVTPKMRVCSMSFVEDVVKSFLAPNPQK